MDKLHTQKENAMDKTEINQKLNYNECYITLYTLREREINA